MMERIGLRFFRRLSEKYPQNFSPDDIHFLNHEERAHLKRIQNGAVLRAAIAGGLSAGVAVLGGVLLEPMLQGQIESPPLELYLPYFLTVTAIGIVATVFEISFLYWDSLRTVHRISSVAGLDLFPNHKEDVSVAMALVRAALELPNPPDDLEGVNPRREVSKFRLILGTLLYKIKASATNFIAKAIVRRMVGRSGFRVLIEFVAVPVFAVWNALICWWVLRQARIRAMGPSAANEYMGFVLENAKDFDVQHRPLFFQAVGAAIVRTVDVHPNLVAVMEILDRKLGNPGNIVLDDTKLFLVNLASSPTTIQIPVLQTLTLAAILDGKISRDEKGLLASAFEACGLESDTSRAADLCKAFVRGDDMTKEMVLECLPPRKS